MRIPKFLVVIIVLIIFAITAYFFVKQIQTKVIRKNITVNLTDYSKSGQTGVATLSEKDGKVTVSVVMAGTKYDAPQPAHIHAGACPKIGPVIFPLEDVVNGKSVTTLDTSMADLLAKASSLNINIHHSYDDFKSYTACGDIN